MGYAGEVLDSCGTTALDFRDAQIVAVSGSGPNVCGHLLLYVSDRGGYYYHVAELHGRPRYMSEGGYRRYLKDEGKTELKRRRVPLPNPEGALIYLESLMSETWTWGVLPNNCVAFVEEVIKAGGGTWSSASNCPTVATAATLSERIQQFYSQLELNIYQLYGVPR